MKHIRTIIIFVFLITLYDCNGQIKKSNLIEFEIDFDYWEGCETGKGDCNPLKFERKSKQDSIVLIMPCGGTATTVHLTKPGQEKPIKTLSIGHDECPPIFDLTGFEDGEYGAFMWACGLGGPITFILTTKND